MTGRPASLSVLKMYKAKGEVNQGREEEGEGVNGRAISRPVQGEGKESLEEGGKGGRARGHTARGVLATP